jgi:hypothetical protein
MNWTNLEVEVAVKIYFVMLALEIKGKEYNKTEFRKILLKALKNRTDGSVEFKHCNISAVLIEMGIPYIDGYKPRGNYQHSIVPVVKNYLHKNPQIIDLLKYDSEASVSIPIFGDILSALEDAPQPDKVDSEPYTVAGPNPVYYQTGINYLEMEARNQALGSEGENFVIKYEKARLTHIGRENLADRIEQVSETIGPIAGYDIRSFEEDGSDRFVEVKTTKYGNKTPFFITKNELEFSRINQNSYYLYRVYKFRKNPKLFTLHGFVEDQCCIYPSEYIAKP